MAHANKSVLCLKKLGETKKKIKLKILKLNVDENPQTPQKFGVRGIPSLMLFKEGSLVDTKVGSLPKNTLEAWLKLKFISISFSNFYQLSKVIL